MSWAKFVMVACLLIAGTGVAQAASDADTARQYGLLGNWAFDCSKPPSNDNPYESYAANGSRVIRTLLMSDAGLTGTSELHGLQISGDMLTATWVRDSDGSVTITTMEKKNGKRHGWKSVAADGHAFITDGKFAGGGDTPWFARCADK